jgi:hypothetical protein
MTRTGALAADTVGGRRAGDKECVPTALQLSVRDAVLEFSAVALGMAKSKPRNSDQNCGHSTLDERHSEKDRLGGGGLQVAHF